LTSPLQLRRYETLEDILSNNLTIYSLPIYHEGLKSYVANGIRQEENHGQWLKLYWTAEVTKIGKMYLHTRNKPEDQRLQRQLKRLIKVPKIFFGNENDD